MRAKRKRESGLVAVTNQYPAGLLEGLNALVAETHIPKAHHLREGLRRYLEAHGYWPRPLWEFCGDRVTVIISSVDRGRSARLSEMYALIELGDRLGPSAVDVFLSSDGAWKREAVVAGDLIVLGGPRHNRAAVEVLRHWGELMPFELRDRRSGSNPTYTLQNRDTGEAWVPDSPHADRVASDFNDFGLVVKAPGPHGSGTWLLCAGCHAFGTHAAVRALLDPRSVAVISRMLPSAEAHFAAVVQVRVRNFSPEPPTIADLVTISG